MTAVPSTVRAALADRPVDGAVCLDAGAGVGNSTAGLLAAGARRVYAVTNDRADARAVRTRVGRRQDDRIRGTGRTDAGQTGLDDAGRTAVLEADLRAVPLRTASVDLVVAHALFNLLTPAAAHRVAAELTRVAAPGGHLVVDDYDPLPPDAAVGDLFAVENAATTLATGRPNLTFYPSAVLRHLFCGFGWTVDREFVLLDPVPWTATHLAAHAAVAREAAATLPNPLGATLDGEARRLVRDVGSEAVGTMYSVAFRAPD